MKANDFLDHCERRLGDLMARLNTASAGLSDDDWNRPIPPSQWNGGQIVQHMILANEPYLKALPHVIDRSAPDTTGMANLSWFGRMLSKGAGPSGNVPAPKASVPKEALYGREIVETLASQVEVYRELVAKARGKDLATRFANPFVPLFKMNLADAFQVLADHTERHVGQIEEGHGLRQSAG